MTDELKNLRKAMDQHVFTEQHFTPKQKQEVMRKIQAPNKRKMWAPRVVGVLLAVFVLCVGVYFIQSEIEVTKPANEQLQFSLTAEEQTAYQDFLVTYDLDVLEGLEPKSVAKLFIEASANQEHDMMYELYTDRSDHVAWSREEDMSWRDQVHDTAENVYAYFQHFEEGEFHQTGEYEGVVEFKAAEKREVPSIFQLIQNEDGIWQVAFMPIQ